MTVLRPWSRARARRPVRALAALAAVVGTLGGCGSGSEAGVTLLATEDFGSRPLADLPQPKTTGAATPLGLLEANVRVRTRARTVQSVEGARAGTRGVRTRAWSAYVNGVRVDRAGTIEDLHAGDAVWWDLHDQGATARVPAVVGSFPAPFADGVDGKRLPVRIECSPADIPGCQTVQDAMTAAGVFAAQGGLQQSISKETLRIVVGPWRRIRADDTVKLLAGGPRASGVYVRPAADARSIAVLNPRGHVTRSLGPGDGLVAATRLQDGQPVWIVTGVDAAGVKAATQALDAGNLKDHFALAVVDGRALAVPEVARGR